MENSTYNPER